MRNRNTLRRLKTGVIALLILVMMLPSMKALAATATVTASNVKIRASADTSSSTVGSVTNGSKLDVIGSTQGADGYTWYQVWVNGNQKGFVRGDLVSVEGSVSAVTDTTPAAESTTTTTTEQTQALPETSVTSMDAQAAVISADSCNIRSGAGTGYSSVANVKKGTAVTLTGTAQGTDSKVWYQVSFVNNGATVTGFVRSDLVTVGQGETTAEDPAATGEGEAPAEGEGEAVEETTAEEPVEETPAEPEGPQCDYEIVYADDASGNSDWYLYNYAQGNRLKLNDVINAATSNSALIEEQASKISRLTIIVAILAVLLLAAVIGLTLLFFRLREYSDEDDDDDDDDDEDDDEDEDDEDDDDEDDDDDDDDRGFLRRRDKSRGVKSRPAPQRAPQRQPQRTGKPAAPQGRTVQKTQLVRKADGTLVRRVITTTEGASAGASRGSVQSAARPTTNKNAQNAVRNGESASRAAHEDAQTLRDAQAQLSSSVREVIPETPKKPAGEKNGVKWKSKNFLSDDDDLELTFLEDDRDE